MSNLRFWCIAAAVTVISSMLTYYHFVYTGDTVAAVFGYFGSLAILPLMLVTFLVILVRVVMPDIFTTTQKWLLLLAPLSFMLLGLVYLYWQVQYRSH